MLKVIENKVIAAAAGSGAGAALSAFLLWLLGVLLWHASSDAGKASEAVASVPTPVAGVVAIVVTALGAFIAGYAAPHTVRPDLGEGTATLITTNETSGSLPPAPPLPTELPPVS